MCEIKECFLIEAGYWIDKEKNIFKRKEFLPATLIRSVMVKRKNTGIFQTAYLYNTEKQDEAYLYGDFYLDFDSDCFELVRKDAIKAISYLKIVFNLKLIRDQMKIFYSGNKGVHIIVPAKILGIEPRQNLNEIFKTIAININEYLENKTIDLRIYDKKRLFRIPNSIHEKTGLHKVEISLEELKTLKENEIKELAKNIRSLKHNDYKLCTSAKKMYNSFIDKTEIRLNDYNVIKSSGTLKYTPPCVIFALENGAKSGERNNTIAVLASFFKSSGKDSKETLDIISKWNEEKNSIPTSLSELTKTINSIYHTVKKYGCSSIKTLGLCNKEECKFKYKKGKS